MNFEEREKLKAYADQCSQAQCIGGQIGLPLPVHEAEMNARNHRQEAEKHERVAAFLHENPAFGDFIQLLRDGAIRV